MHQKLKVPVWLLFMSSIAVAQGQTSDNLKALDELDLAREFLEATEEEIGRHALALVEPLEQLADRLVALNQFADADDLLDRAIQITRFHNGLHTPAQLSLIRKRIDNFSNRQAWDDAREQMDYMFGYYLRVPVALNENLIADFLALAEQHLRGATEDSEIEQGRHLSRVYQINQALITAAVKLHGEDSPLLAPYLYRQVQLLYLFKKGFDDGGRDRANSMLYYTIKGQSFPWTRDRFKGFSFGEGLILLERIRDIFDESDQTGLEGLAMIELYLADWHMLFDYAGEASERYESAYVSLLASGASEGRVNAFFNEPRVLPIQQFHASMEAAHGESSPASADTQGSAEDRLTHHLSLEEWSPSYPTARSPLNPSNRSEGNVNFALFEFTLPAENESTFLYKNTYKQTIGAANDVELVEGFRGFEVGNEAALSRLNQLRFRPRIVNGEPVESRSRLRYEITTGTN